MSASSSRKLFSALFTVPATMPSTVPGRKYWTSQTNAAGAFALATRSASPADAGIMLAAAITGHAYGETLPGPGECKGNARHLAEAIQAAGIAVPARGSCQGGDKGQPLTGEALAHALQAVATAWDNAVSAATKKAAPKAAPVVTVATEEPAPEAPKAAPETEAEKTHKAANAIGAAFGAVLENGPALAEAVMIEPHKARQAAEAILAALAALEAPAPVEVAVPVEVAEIAPAPVRASRKARKGQEALAA